MQNAFIHCTMGDTLRMRAFLRSLASDDFKGFNQFRGFRCLLFTLQLKQGWAKHAYAVYIGINMHAPS